MDYKKFADLPAYLFGEVHKNWHRRGYLRAEEFFCIVIWKANRSKGKIKKRLLHLGELDAIVKAITSDIHNADTYPKILKTLIHKYGFRLPMASAIAAVHSPRIFVLYDVRGRESLGIKDFSHRKDAYSRYFTEYLAKIDQIVKGTAREQDAWIWGKSFYNDLEKLLKGK